MKIVKNSQKLPKVPKITINHQSCPALPKIFNCFLITFHLLSNCSIAIQSLFSPFPIAFPSLSHHFPITFPSLSNRFPIGYILSLFLSKQFPIKCKKYHKLPNVATHCYNLPKTAPKIAKNFQ